MECSQPTYARLQRARATLRAGADEASLDHDPNETWVGLLQALRDSSLGLSALLAVIQFATPELTVSKPEDIDAENELNPLRALANLDVESPRRYQVLSKCCQALDQLTIRPEETEFDDDDSGILDILPEEDDFDQ